MSQGNTWRSECWIDRTKRELRGLERITINSNKIYLKSTSWLPLYVATHYLIIISKVIESTLLTLSPWSDWIWMSKIDQHTNRGTTVLRSMHPFGITDNRIQMEATGTPVISFIMMDAPGELDKWIRKQKLMKHHKI